MNAIARLFSPAEVTDSSAEFLPGGTFDARVFDEAFVDENYDAPEPILETPTQRDLREAEEAVTRYDAVIAGCDKLLSDTQAQKAEATRLRAGRKAQIAAIKLEAKALSPSTDKPKRGKA